MIISNLCAVITPHFVPLYIYIMSQYRLSQLAPLPELGGIKIGNTVGHGGFGVVKSAVANFHHSKMVIAVKFVHIQMAARQRVTVKKLIREAKIQGACRHKNIIAMYDYGMDSNWVWMAMEMGSNGELFDKIEPDRGVDEEVAHFYFIQLINAIEYIHRLGVAHCDIKPENLVLDSGGNLKLTDFGLAVVFRKKNGPKRLSTLPCGSPPYLAPEVVSKKYDPEISDIWSCGMVLFVLLTGKIAWEIPHPEDPDYKYFVENKGEVLVAPWNKLPIGALSLLRKLLNPDPQKRITIPTLKKQPWFAKKNCFMNSEGLCKDTLHLTTRLLVSLYINLSDEEFNKVSETATQASTTKKLPETQPVEYLMDDLAPSSSLYKDNYKSSKMFASSQIEYTEHTKRRKLKRESNDDNLIFSLISKDPASLQFIGKGREKAISDKISELQLNSRRAPDLLALSLTRFFSVAPLKQILLTILESLLKLGLRTNRDYEDNESMVKSLSESDSLSGTVSIPITGRDSGNLMINGLIRITRIADNLNARKVEFIKTKADPLEWRRIFRKVTVLCRDIVYVEK